MLWPDTFTNSFHPHIGQAAVTVLEAAGWRVDIPTEPVCCGLTWISTGQLAVAKRVLTKTVADVAEHLRAGGLIVGLEPSCTAVFRSDALELFPEDQDVRRLASQTVTLSELLTQHTPGWTPPRLPQPMKAIAQVHCHQHAVMGWEADAEILAQVGVDAEPLESGCCGLAGNFGYEPGHTEVSEACAEAVLLPRVRGADPSTAVLADGFSCRTQIDLLDSGGRRAAHIAEVLAAAVRGTQLPTGEPVENTMIQRPSAVPATVRGSITAAAAAFAAAGLTLAARKIHRR